jgi:hypothetical protein
MGYVEDEVTLEQDFLPELLLLRVNNLVTSAPYLFIYQEWNG